MALGEEFYFETHFTVEETEVQAGEDIARDHTAQRAGSGTWIVAQSPMLAHVTPRPEMLRNDSVCTALPRPSLVRGFLSPGSKLCQQTAACGLF